MKIACLCCTYNRPRELANAIACFDAQDYPYELLELIVLDDAGQYPRTIDVVGYTDNVKVITLPRRFRTLGEKRNACAGLCSPDADAFCVWDDDDTYLPWHVSTHVTALQGGAEFVIPSIVYLDKKTELARKSNTYLFHGGWSFRRSAFESVRGYPFIQSGQDRGLFDRFKAAKMKRDDPLRHDVRPSYIYSWFTTHTKHISAGAGNSYENLGLQEIDRQPWPAPRLIRNWEKLQRDEQERYAIAE